MGTIVDFVATFEQLEICIKEQFDLFLKNVPLVVSRRKLEHNS
jgi:hypothetical protein